MTTDQPLTFAALLKRYRRIAGLTQEALAERAGYSTSYVSLLERGERHPVLATVELLSRTLHLTADEHAAFAVAARRSHASPTPLVEGVQSGQVDQPGSALSAAVQTFLFADLRGYTRFAVERGDEAAAALAARFATLVRKSVEPAGGRLLELRGDEALAIFSSARRAIRAAVALQEHLAAETRADPALWLPAGIGLDAGEAVPVEGGYRGGALNLAARLCKLAGPAEVLSTETVVHLAGTLGGLIYKERGLVQLKGLADPVRVLEVRPEAPAPASGAWVDGAAELDQQGNGSPGDGQLPLGSFLGALPESPLVARERELGQIVSALEAVVGGAGRLVTLAGEPGVGKTRLAQEVTLTARNRGFLVATGRCYEPQQKVAYYPFREALETGNRSAPASVREEAPRRWPDIVRLLPDYSALLPATPAMGGQDEQQRLFWAVTSLVQALAERQPVAIVLDDLHWADGASLNLLLHLARHTRGCRVLLVGTYRDVEIRRGHPLQGALRDLVRERLVERVAVRRLPAAGTAALMAVSLGMGTVSDEFAELVHRHTEGNPFYTQEVLRALVERGDVYRQGEHWQRRAVGEITVPESVRAAIDERVGRLGSPVEDLLKEASVLGQTFGFADLAGMTDRQEAEVEAALEEAVAAGLVLEGDADSYAFSHALVQQALYAGLPSRRRRRLHLAAGDALERLPERGRARRDAELAWHFMEGDDAERALPCALRAGDQAEAVFAHGEAVQHYTVALELASELGDQQRAAEAQEKLGLVHMTVARYDQARDALDRAAESYRIVGNLEGLGRATALLGRVHGLRGTPDEGIARLQQMLAPHSVTGLSSGRLADLYIALAQLFSASGRYREALDAAERAVELARAAQDDRLLAQAEMRHGQALAVLGRLEDSVSALADVARLLEALGDLQSLSDALNNVAVVYEVRGEFDQEGRYIQRALEVAERLGDPTWTAFMVYRRGFHAFMVGEWERARADLERAAEMARQVGTSWVSAQVLFGLGLLSLAEGQRKEGVQYLEEVITLAERSGDLRALRLAHSALAEHDLLEGHPDSARLHLEPLLDSPGQQERHVTLLLPLLAWAHLDQGDESQAEELIVQAAARATAQQNRIGLLDVLRVQALLALRGKRWEEAQSALEEALAHTRIMRFPYAQVRVLHTYGLLHVEKGEREQAVERFEEALTICARLGERAYAGRIEQTLAQLRAAVTLVE
jgi:class 3 adenylate cyclase/tetratricopeptide (TPR) repeat protein